MRFEALDLALALHAQPQRVDAARARALPAGVTEVLRIALAHDATLTAAVAATGLPSQQLSDAARFFVEQQILARECQNDPWRTLGVATGADIAEIRDHHRLLVRLVHPDRSDEWASAFADRVNKAWRQLRDESGRAQALTTVADTDAEFGQRLDVRTPPSNPVDAWAVRPPAAVPRPTTAQITTTALPHVRGRSSTVPALAAVAAVVAGGIGLGFWLGVNQHQPLVVTTTPIAMETPATGDDIVAVEAPPITRPTQQSDLPEVNAVGTMPIALKATSIPMPGRFTGPDPRSAPVAARPEPVVAPTPHSPHIARNAPAPPVVASRAPKPLHAPMSPQTNASADASAPASAATAGDHRPTTGATASVVTPDPRPTITQPASVVATVNSKSDAPTPADAQALLDVYVRRYAEGDLGGMLGLFARDVHAEDRRIAAIAQQYSRLFAATSDRVIALRDLQWQQDGSRVVGAAQYETRYRPRNKLRYETTSGRIEFEVVNDGGNSRLLTLNTIPAQRS